MRLPGPMGIREFYGSTQTGEPSGSSIAFPGERLQNEYSTRIPKPPIAPTPAPIARPFQTCLCRPVLTSSRVIPSRGTVSSSPSLRIEADRSSTCSAVADHRPTSLDGPSPDASFASSGSTSRVGSPAASGYAMLGKVRSAVAELRPAASTALTW